MRQLYQSKHLATSQIVPASEMLARAFQDDPMMTYIIPEAAKRPGPIASFFEVCLKFARLNGEVYSTPTTEGAAIWLGPGNITLTVGGAMKAGLLSNLVEATLTFGPSAFGRLLNVGEYTEKNHKLHAPNPHWYLLTLGVEPSQQGRGIGSSLIAPMLEKANSTNLPCYLETMKANNVPLYEKYGFKVVAEGTIPKGGPQVWSMLREPHK